MNTKRVVVPDAEEILGAYFPVLDHGFVSLLDYMGGDVAIERAARCSYTIGQEVRSIDQTKNLIRYLFRHRHTSPFEQVELQFHMGLPIFVMRQLGRHRTSQYNEFSGRYSPMPMMYYTPEPDQVCYQSGDNKQGRSGPVDEFLYNRFASNLVTSRLHDADYYQAALQAGIAKETARIDLPLSTYTFIYWKINLRNLLHLIGLRSDPHAQWEIRVYSDLLAGIARRVCPLAFDAFQDYQLNSISFSQAELRGIRALSHFHVSPLVWDNPPEPIKVEINEVLEEYGIKGREAAEFWAKLRLQTKRDFSLDLSQVKPADYYMQMVANHSLEVAA
jgi:thymidylate synthase (FAD)